MTTYEMLVKSINAKRKRNELNQEAIEDIQGKMDVFLMNDRISEKDYEDLIVKLNDV